MPKVALDRQASIGYKNKHQFWYDYKKHVSVAMQSGLINKVAVMLAHIPDAQGVKQTCPSQGRVYGDKGYCITPARVELKRRGCAHATIKKNNMKAKNKAKGRTYSPMRAPYASVFSQQRRRSKLPWRSKKSVQEIFLCPFLQSEACSSTECICSCAASPASLGLGVSIVSLKSYLIPLNKIKIQ